MPLHARSCDPEFIQDPAFTSDRDEARARVWVGYGKGSLSPLPVWGSGALLPENVEM